MAILSSNFQNLRELFVHELRDLYSAEKQLVDALPKMAEAATSTELRTAFQNHLEETRGHVNRLENVFNLFSEEPEEHTCKAMKGLIAEGDEFISAGGDNNVRDAGLIGAAQRVEHYEMAGYGTLRSLAQRLGEEEAARILQQTLDEEGAADKKLTSIAEGWVNDSAAFAQDSEQRQADPSKPRQREATMPSSRDNPGGMVEKAPFGNT